MMGRLAELQVRMGWGERQQGSLPPYCRHYRGAHLAAKCVPWQVSRLKPCENLPSSFTQSLSRLRLFGTPWTAARQASLSITNSQSLLKLMSIELVMPSNHLILCRPLLLTRDKMFVW